MFYVYCRINICWTPSDDIISTSNGDCVKKERIHSLVPSHKSNHSEDYNHHRRKPVIRRNYDNKFTYNNTFLLSNVICADHSVRFFSVWFSFFDFFFGFAFIVFLSLRELAQRVVNDPHFDSLMSTDTSRFCLCVSLLSLYMLDVIFWTLALKKKTHEHFFSCCCSPPVSRMRREKKRSQMIANINIEAPAIYAFLPSCRSLIIYFLFLLRFRLSLLWLMLLVFFCCFFLFFWNISFAFRSLSPERGGKRDTQKKHTVNKI